MAETSTKASEKKSAGEGIKETIESIVIAFILAFVFRAFVVEAFVIPTGSMATTLLGAHYRLTCPDCGQQFKVGHVGDGDGDRTSVKSVTNESNRIQCRGCGFTIPERMKQQLPVYYGDRILVLKYIWLLEEPQRWDVVVFKNPNDQDGQYAENYIKRLVGRPGEQLMIFDGDVYIRQGDDQPWVVQTKPRAVQEAVWRTVYDNDHLPRSTKMKGGFVQPWKPVSGKGWSTGGRVFEFDNADGAGTLGFDSAPQIEDGELGRRWYPLTDRIAYNIGNSGKGRYYYVSDVRLALFYERHSGSGPLDLTLSKYDQAFTARIADGKATLYGRRLAGPVEGGSRDLGQELKSVAVDVPVGRPVEIELENFDYRVALRIDGREVLATTPKEYAPELPEEFTEDAIRAYGQTPPQIRVTAANQRASISHVRLDRDLYYRLDEYEAEGKPGSIHYRGHPTNIVRLAKKAAGGQDDEYFVLGDNSEASLDARMWGDRSAVDLVGTENVRTHAGTVPGRFMIGKAFFVYWPAGFRPFSNDLPVVIPNFGEMRFIE